MVLCDSGAYGKLKIYTHGHVYIVSIIMKVVYSEITSNIEIKNIIPYFLGAGWRIWPSIILSVFLNIMSVLDKFTWIKQIKHI